MTTIEKAPHCIGFILDGNRRWARQHGRSTKEGHAQGLKTLEDVILWTQELGVPHMVCYAFSTENWNRSEQEVTYLLELFQEGIVRLHKKLQERSGIRTAVRFIGQRGRFSEKLQEEIARIEASAPSAPDCTVWIGLSYGGRAEIVDAANRAIEQGMTVTEDTLQTLFWSAGMPDPDLIIRTGGEQRLSNFLPWQSVYSELFFVDTYWPDFSKDEFQGIVEAYGERTRRKGT